MVIKNNGPAVKPILKRPIKPVTTQSEAISAQLSALGSVTPVNSTQADAVKKQTNFLNDYETVQKRQTRVSTAYATSNTQQLLTPANTNVAVSLVDKEAQIKALATDVNRNKLVTAVKYALDMWRLQAHFQNIIINGQIAIANPGCLAGPDLKPWIVQAPSVYSATGYFKTMVSAIAEGVANNFKQWQDFVTVPGLPWYPAFSAFPGPFAPPMPNIPMPLVVCVSQKQNKIMSPTQMESAIKSVLPKEFLLSEMDLFYFPLTVNIANQFTTWLCSQQVSMVMGMGPVPTFNPPYVPVGPVVNGYIIPSPGHLAV